MPLIPITFELEADTSVGEHVKVMGDSIVLGGMWENGFELQWSQKRQFWECYEPLHFPVDDDDVEDPKLELSYKYVICKDNEIQWEFDGGSNRQLEVSLLRKS